MLKAYFIDDPEKLVNAESLESLKQQLPFRDEPMPIVVVNDHNYQFFFRTETELLNFKPAYLDFMHRLAWLRKMFPLTLFAIFVGVVWLLTSPNGRFSLPALQEVTVPLRLFTGLGLMVYLFQVLWLARLDPHLIRLTFRKRLLSNEQARLQDAGYTYTESERTS